MMLLTLAWRNIWRNLRRTLITISSILFAVLFAAVMSALQEGAWDYMIGNAVNYFFGYAQIHQDGYWDDQSIDKAFPLADSLLELPQSVSQIQGMVPRIESFALASTGRSTSGVMVVGIEPERENAMTNLQERLVSGAFLRSGDRGSLIGKGVAERLNLTLHDTIVLVSQGYHGVNAAGKYPVQGILNFPSPDLNKQMVYLPLAEAQWFYGADGLVTSLALKLPDQHSTMEAVEDLRMQLDTTTYEVMDWKEMMPELLEARALDTAGNVIVYIILYLIIAFGLFGTILMMTNERGFEFGILLSIGMKRIQLAFTLVVEILLLGLLGALAGIIVSLPIVYYFHLNPLEFGGDYAASMEQFGFEPVFPMKWAPDVFLRQALIVFIITLLLSAYPVYAIFRTDPVSAMRES